LVIAVSVALIALVMVLSALVEDVALRERRRRRTREQARIAAE
jgi:heme exporter protein D